MKNHYLDWSKGMQFNERQCIERNAVPRKMQRQKEIRCKGQTERHFDLSLNL
jgi:hypothetical protein